MTKFDMRGVHEEWFKRLVYHYKASIRYERVKATNSCVRILIFSSFLLLFCQVFSSPFSLFWLSFLFSFLFFDLVFITFCFPPSFLLLFYPCFFLMWFHLCPTPIYLGIKDLIVVVCCMIFISLLDADVCGIWSSWNFCSSFTGKLHVHTSYVLNTDTFEQQLLNTLIGQSNHYAPGTETIYGRFSP
jgi:hypothetical protein